MLKVADFGLSEKTYAKNYFRQTGLHGDSEGEAPVKLPVKWMAVESLHALYIGMAKVLPTIDVLGYDGQNSSFSSPPPPPHPPPYSDSTPITQKGSHISP